MKLRYSWFFAILLPCLTFAAPGVGSFKEGVDYTLLAKPQPTESGNKVEVLELFWYGCPHCYKLEPTLDAWLEHLPDNVVYRRLPAIFSKSWEVHARVYYTAEALGVLEKTHRPFFDAIHLGKRRMLDEREIADFFAKYGVKREDFSKTYRSFAVQTKVQRAKAMTRRYGITGVPALIVNGKYRTGVGQAKGAARMMQVINALVAKEAGS